MKALTWQGINELEVIDVRDPHIQNNQDIIVKVLLSSTCGSDLHLIDGYLPAMEKGDVLGHEFMGEIVEVGQGVKKRRVGERVVVCSPIACGRCWYCEQGLTAFCDNSNTNPSLGEAAFGFATAGVYGYSHMMGGFAGSHAEYIRVPYGDWNAFPIPDGVSNEAAVFASDAVPTGWMGAEFGGVKPGDVVAVWGCGAVGQMAARAAMLMGAEQVIAIDQLPERLEMTEKFIGCQTLDFSKVDVGAELREMTGGRGPDVCIEAVGMEAAGKGMQQVYDRVKQAVRLESDRAITAREAIHACRKGGTVFFLGVFGITDKFPIGAVINKGLTVKGSQQHGHRWVEMLLDRIDNKQISTEHLITHDLPLERAPQGYRLFKEKEEGCVRAVFRP